MQHGWKRSLVFTLKINTYRYVYQKEYKLKKIEDAFVFNAHKCNFDVVQIKCTAQSKLKLIKMHSLVVVFWTNYIY